MAAANELNNLSDIYRTQLTDSEFKKLSTYIQDNYGIKLPEVKKIMLQSRLHKRLRELQMTTFKDYIDYVFSKHGSDEIIHMIDVVSTNKTDFFREPQHFDLLTSTILPELVTHLVPGTPLKVWSAACSSGEEPYTLAMVFEEFKQSNPLLSYKILGSDISTIVLKKAAEAIYSEDRITELPLNLKRKYFLKSKDSTKKLVRVAPHLRERVSFMRVNFMDDVYAVPEMYDIIFCRNALIYFDKETQESVITKLCNKLRPGGFFFLGHSETITGMSVPLQAIKPTVFRRK